jgi:hypothetical protein
MAKPVTGDMVEPYLNDEFGPQWLLFVTSFSAPAARTTGSFSGEAGCLAQSLKPLRQACPFSVGNGGSEADMVEPALGIVESEKQRSDLPTVAFLAEAADDAVSGPQLLHLDHRPFARLVGRASCFAITPSVAPCPASRSHASAAAKSVVAGERTNLLGIPASAMKSSRR